MWHYHDGMGWWMVFIGITMAILFIGIIWALIRDGWRTSNMEPDDKTSDKNALNIAKERYARGEISRSEYEQIRQDIA